MEDEFALPPHLKCEATYPSFAAGLQRRMDTMKETEQVRGYLCHHCGTGTRCFAFTADLPFILSQGRLKFERTEAGKIPPHLWASLFSQHWLWLLASVSMQGIYNAFNFRPVDLRCCCA